MNKLIKFSRGLLIAAVTFMFSCKEDDKTEQIELKLSETEKTVGFAAGSFKVGITANGKWEAVPYNSWCTVSPESGNGSDSITISYSENATGADRSATVEITASGASQNITVKQTASIPTFEVNPLNPELNVVSGESIIEFEIKSNLQRWSIVIPTWCKAVDGYPLSYSRSASEPTNIKTHAVKIRVLENTAKNDRQTVLGIDGKGWELIRITLTQEGAAYYYAPSESGQLSIPFTGSWTATCDNSWCTVPASGNGDISVSFVANTDKIPRKAIVVITSGQNVKYVSVAQEGKLNPNFSQSWTDVNGVRHTSIPTDKKFWNTGEVLEYTRATKGAGVNIVVFNDGFNKMEMAVGGAYETSVAEALELFLSMPVIRDYKEYFNLSALMTVWAKSDIFSLYDFHFRNPNDGRQGEFLPKIMAMPQIQGVASQDISAYYFANGFSGGFNTEFPGGLHWSSYQYRAEGNYPYWTFHEFLGHCFAALGDMYQAPDDLSEWDITPKEKIAGIEQTGDQLNRWDWARNCFIAEWNQNAWDAFISKPGNSQYAGNLEKYRLELPADYKTKHPSYTGGGYIWRFERGSNFMDQHVLNNSPWDRYLIYRRIMLLAGVNYSLVDFFEADQKYADVPDWYTLLGLHGWSHSFLYESIKDGKPSPFQPWDE
ncbi:MAG: BACON domain-containing protein [Prevotellaceae bacterium]|jgi:hypothetical protein|nr:BACON domain-containing protein [Prevotellaceae bacterium]